MLATEIGQARYLSSSNSDRTMRLFNGVTIALLRLAMALACLALCKHLRCQHQLKFFGACVMG